MAKSKFIFVALIVSLAINLAIAGFVGAQWFRHGGHPGPQASLTFDRHAAFSVLDEEREQQIKDIWRQHRPQMRSNYVSYRKAKKHLSSLLSAQKLDKEAIEKAHAEMIGGRNEVEKTLTKALVETAEILPPETRAKFFERGFKRWKSRHHPGKISKQQK